MTLEQLSEFITVAQYKNYSKAAEALFITQPALSRHIASLEERLGTVLLERNNRYVRLTEAGQLLYDEGSVLLESLRDLEERVTQRGKGIKGSLSVVSHPLYDERLFSAYKSYCEDYPDVAFKLTHKPSGVTSGYILEELADISISFSFEMDANMKGDIGCVPLFRDRFVIVIPENHRFAARARISVSELVDEPLLLLEVPEGQEIERSDEAIRQISAGSAHIFASQVERISRSALSDMIMKVKAGLGWAILPGPIAREHISGCVLADIDNPGDPCIDFDVVMAWRLGNANPCCKNLREYILGAFHAESSDACGIV